MPLTLGGQPAARSYLARKHSIGHLDCDTLARVLCSSKGPWEGTLSNPSAKQLAVIILHYNNREYLPACFRRLAVALREISHEIWLVDNQSTDGTPAFVQQEFPEINCLVTTRNGGFSYGNNVGLRQLGFGDEDRNLPPSFHYVMLLNPDTEVHPDALHNMLDFMAEHQDVGVVGPRLVRANGELDHGCKRGEPTPWAVFCHIAGLSRLFPRSPHFAQYTLSYVGEQATADVDSVSGACQLMRGTALKEVGLLDEKSFFMYGEDLDHCLRFRQRGWRVVYRAEARVLHHKGSATRKSSGVMILAFHRAMAAFHRKHYAGRTPFWLNWIIYGSIWLLGWLKFGRNRLRPAARRFVGSARPMSS